MVVWGAESGNNRMILINEVGLGGENGFTEEVICNFEDELDVTETVGADQIISSGVTCEACDPVLSLAILDTHPT